MNIGARLPGPLGAALIGAFFSPTVVQLAYGNWLPASLLGVFWLFILGSFCVGRIETITLCEEHEQCRNNMADIGESGLVKLKKDGPFFPYHRVDEKTVLILKRWWE